MVVSLYSNWKIPITYFSINGIVSQTNARIVTTALLLHDVGVKVVLLTLEEPSQHFNTTNLLGAIFTLDDPKPFC